MRAYLRIMRAKVVQYWQEGVVSSATIQHMLNAFDWAIDLADFDSYHFWNQFTVTNSIFSSIVKRAGKLFQ